MTWPARKPICCELRVTGSSPEERAQPPAQPSLAVLAFGALGLATLAFFAIEALPALLNALARASFIYADSQWSEWPLSLQLHRIAVGGAAYLPTALANSYDYGPLYLMLLGGVRRVASLGDDIVTYRTLSMAIGGLTVVPLAYASVAIAERASVVRGGAGKAAVAAAAIALAVAVLARSITFDTLHPDNLAALTIAMALAIHLGIAARRLHPGAVWGLVAVGIASAFGKQNAAVVVPLLLAGLAVARVIPPRVAVAAFAATIAGIVALIALMPGDERAWTLLVPLGQPYEFTAARIADCWRFLTYWEPYLALSLAPAGVMLYTLWRRCGARALAVDGAVLGAVALVSFSAFFKALGIWNNLTFLCLGTVPYASALLGLFFVEKAFDVRRGILASVAFASLIAVGTGLRTAPKQVADAQINTELSAVYAMAKELCATRQTILVTAFPDAFFGCPTAAYALTGSYLELQVAFPRYNGGPTAFDAPATAHYVVTTAAVSGPARPPLPGAWAAGYPHVAKDLPAVSGWGANYFPIRVKVFEHR